MVIKTGVEARDALIKGANFMADAVKSTLGPYGANAALEKGDKITNDGKTIAQEFCSKDEIENRGINILRQAATRTDDRVGDGTTTAITLAQAILKSAVRMLPKDKLAIGKMTGIEVINKIDAEFKLVSAIMKEMAKPIETKEQLVNVATVSVEDKDLGKLIGESQFELGPNGYLIAEEANQPDHSIKLVKGIRIDNGFSTNLIAFDPATQSLVTQKTKTLLTNNVIDNLDPLAPLIKQLWSMKCTNLVIVARGFSSVAIKQCLDYLNSGFTLYPINAPYTDQNEIMEDLAALLGGRYINTERTDLAEVMVSDIGFAEHIVARRWDSIFTGSDDAESKSRLEKRVADLNKAHAASESDFEKKHILGRIAQLECGFGIVKIGGPIAKRKYLMDKAVDAVNSVRNAYQEGVIPGAGIGLVQISDQLPSDSILKPALRAVHEQIILSAPKDFVVPAWVVDSVKVIRIALEEACAVAGVFSTTLIATAQEFPKPKYMQEVANQDK